MDRGSTFIITGVIAAAGIAVCYILWGPSTVRRSRSRGSVLGLRNLGQTCYVNSLLQALASCHYFVEWINEQENLGEVAQSIKKLINILSGKQVGVRGDVLSPSEVIQALHRGGWALTNSQQDVHELFCTLIAILEEEAYKACLDLTVSIGTVAEHDSSNSCKEVNKNSCSNCKLSKAASISHPDEKMPNGTCASSIPDEKFTKAYQLKFCGDIRKPLLRKLTAHDLNQSPKPSPFRGYLTNRIQCTKCNYKSVLRYDKFDIISLNLPDTPMRLCRHPLSALLDDFVKYEVIPGIQCESCNKDRPADSRQICTSAIKLIRFGKLPPCLCLHIVRTAYHAFGPYKRQDIVEFPEYISMDPYVYVPRKNNSFNVSEHLLNSAEDSCNENEFPSLNSSEGLNAASGNYQYRLKSVIVHKGTHSEGHFIAYRRGTSFSLSQHRCSEQRWFLVSDSDVREASMEEVYSCIPYLLFYEKCTSLPPPTPPPRANGKVHSLAESAKEPNFSQAR